MHLKNIDKGVSVWEQDVSIPTYSTGNPDRNPMFFEKRIYQGSSGKIYPYSVIDEISGEKKDKPYRAVFLENKYIHIMILPKLGGKIHLAYDKVNRCDFVYHNQVIKPAFAGIGGPFVAGGISFNWPMRHRTGAFPETSYKVTEGNDGSSSVYISDIEMMSGIKGITKITLHPEKAYIEVSCTAINRSALSKAFSWWTEISVPMSDFSQTILPPDVKSVLSEDKNETSGYPLSTDVFHGQDNSHGVDISMHKNLSVPTSFTTCNSGFDFQGSYDHARKTGMLHVSEHHISPGKGLHTWGMGDYGRAWLSNLSDEKTPFVTLVSGSYTDNFHDFSYLSPFEEKSFTQYFMPYSQLGTVKNASVNAAVNLSMSGNLVSVSVYASSLFRDAKVLVFAGEESCYQNTVDLSPENVFTSKYVVDSSLLESELKVEVYDNSENLLVSYSPKETFTNDNTSHDGFIPDPKTIKNTQDTFLYARHLEQLPHSLYSPEDYYKEGLGIDPSDTRLNSAYGALLLKRGDFIQARKHFEAAIKTLKKTNLNLHYGEVFYNLGVTLRYMNEQDYAYDAFYKSTWSNSWQSAAYYQLASICLAKRQYSAALDHAEKAISGNYHNMKARTLKAVILRITGQEQAAIDYAKKILEYDPLDFAAIYESGDSKKLMECMGKNENGIIGLAIEYANSGQYKDSIHLLKAFKDSFSENENISPLVYYYLAHYLRMDEKDEEANEVLYLAGKSAPGTSFPHRLDDILVLNNAAVHNSVDYLAYYFLGCIWYDKKQYERAISCWETSRRINDNFPTVHRNLAIGYYNILDKPKLASQALRKAFALDPSDARVFTELDQLNRKMGVSPSERIIFFEDNFDIVSKKDGLYIEYVKLKNFAKDYTGALKLLEERVFHPREGSEGKVPAQYVSSLIELSRLALASQDYKGARSYLEKALRYPENLGEGKLPGMQENQIYYYLGVANAGLKDSAEAARCFGIASEGISDPEEMIYRYNQPLEGIYYQGLALMKLGYDKKAKSKFNKLINYGEKHLDDIPGDDYFRIPLSERHIFRDNLNQRNKSHCYYMIGLGYLGLGIKMKAKKYLSMALELDVNHLGVRNHLELCYD